MVGLGRCSCMWARRGEALSEAGDGGRADLVRRDVCRNVCVCVCV